MIHTQKTQKKQMGDGYRAGEQWEGEEGYYDWRACGNGYVLLSVFPKLSVESKYLILTFKLCTYSY